jgi:hypothetical protein
MSAEIRPIHDTATPCAFWPRTCKLLGLLCGHCPQMPQITLVTNQHDDNIRIGVVAQLLQPPCDVLVCLVLANIVDKQRSDSASIVCRGDGAVSFLSSSVPNLSFDGLGVDLDGPSSKLDTDCRLGIEVELVAGESAQEVGFTNAGVSDEDDCRGSAAGVCTGSEGMYP